jgi:hypothetical protein
MRAACDADRSWIAAIWHKRVPMTAHHNNGILASIHIAPNNFDQAQHHQQKAHRLNPNYDVVVVQPGDLLT